MQAVEAGVAVTFLNFHLVAAVSSRGYARYAGRRGSSGSGIGSDGDVFPGVGTVGSKRQRVANWRVMGVALANEVARAKEEPGRSATRSPARVIGARATVPDAGIVARHAQREVAKVALVPASAAAVCHATWARCAATEAQRAASTAARASTRPRLRKVECLMSLSKRALPSLALRANIGASNVVRIVRTEPSVALAAVERKIEMRSVPAGKQICSRVKRLEADWALIPVVAVWIRLALARTRLVTLRTVTL